MGRGRAGAHSGVVDDGFLDDGGGLEFPFGRRHGGLVGIFWSWSWWYWGASLRLGLRMGCWNGGWFESSDSYGLLSSLVMMIASMELSSVEHAAPLIRC